MPRLFIIDGAKALSKAICAPLSPYRRPQRMDKNILTSVNFIKDCMLTKDEAPPKKLSLKYPA